MLRLAIPATAAALALLAPGCGSDSKSNDSAGGAPAAAKTTAASQPSALPAGLAGRYSRFVSKADIARTQKKRSEAGPNQEKPQPSRALLFVDAGALTMRTPAGDFVVQEDFSATDHGQLVIRGYQHPERGAFCGPEIPQNATYAWKTSGDRLTLRAVKDPCADRDSTLTGVWKRK